MDLAEELRGSLQEFLVGASIEIRENGSRITGALDKYSPCSVVTLRYDRAFSLLTSCILGLATW
jgi:hypothetical protein